MSADIPAARLDIRVMPRAARPGLGGLRDRRLIVRVAAAPVDGAATHSALAALAAALDVPLSAVRLVSGASSRNKTVAVQGLSAAELQRRLAPFI